jgi:2'-5' RNA ligase
MRCFLAVDIPEELKDRIVLFQRTLLYPGLKKVSRENLHVTMKFLGDVNEKEILSRLEGMNVKRFCTKTTGTGFFPKQDFVRVIWLGLEDNGFSEIVREIETRLNLAKEDFVPHVTIARARKSLRNPRLDFNPNMGMEVSKIALYSSVLTPDGPIYQKLAEFG